MLLTPVEFLLLDGLVQGFCQARSIGGTPTRQTYGNVSSSSRSCWSLTATGTFARAGINLAVSQQSIELLDISEIRHFRFVLYCWSDSLLLKLLKPCVSARLSTPYSSRKQISTVLLSGDSFVARTSLSRPELLPKAQRTCLSTFTPRIKAPPTFLCSSLPVPRHLAVRTGAKKCLFASRPQAEWLLR